MKGKELILELFYKSTAESICYSQSIIFEASYNHSSVPELLTQAVFISIHKKDYSVQSYGVKKLMENARARNLLWDLQHGSLSGRSTVHWIPCVNHWALLMNYGNSVDVLYFDFKSAFEVPNHGKLISCLKPMGVGRKSLNWLKAFLTGRRFRVKVRYE